MRIDRLQVTAGQPPRRSVFSEPILSHRKFCGVTPGHFDVKTFEIRDKPSQSTPVTVLKPKPLDLEDSNFEHSNLFEFRISNFIFPTSLLFSRDHFPDFGNVVGGTKPWRKVFSEMLLGSRNCSR